MVTRRLAALAATAAAVALATPAHAAVHPVCATSLANAAAGTVKTCSSGNTPQVSGAVVVRVVTVEVAAGVTEATITCGYGWAQRSRSITVSGPQPQQFSMYESYDGNCRTSLRAVYDNTTAAAVSTFTYSFIGPRS